MGHVVRWHLTSKRLLSTLLLLVRLLLLLRLVATTDVHLRRLLHVLLVITSLELHILIWRTGGSRRGSLHLDNLFLRPAALLSVRSSTWLILSGVDLRDLCQIWALICRLGWHALHDLLHLLHFKHHLLHLEHLIHCRCIVLLLLQRQRVSGFGPLSIFGLAMDSCRPSALGQL